MNAGKPQTFKPGEALRIRKAQADLDAKTARESRQRKAQADAEWNTPAPAESRGAECCWTCGSPHVFGTYNDPALSNAALAERHRMRGCDVRPVEVKP